MVVGAMVVLWLTGLASQTWGQHDHTPWLFAAMGASALLLIGTPSSPMAQPWPVIGGSLLSAQCWCFRIRCWLRRWRWVLPSW